MTKRFAPLIVCSSIILVAAFSPLAEASRPAASLHIFATATPSTFFHFSGEHVKECENKTGGGEYCDKYYVLVENTGTVATEEPVKVTVRLPEKVKVLPAGSSGYIQGEPERSSKCEEPAPGMASCTFEEPIVPSGFVRMRVPLEVEPSVVGPVHSVVSVQGGGVQSEPAPQEVVTPVGETPLVSGIEQFSTQATGPAGEEDTEAGAHPDLFTTTLGVASTIPEFTEAAPLESIKDLQFYLPVGFVGNAQVAPRCPAALIEGSEGTSSCPPNSQVGDMIPSGIGGIGLETGEGGPENPSHAYGIYNVQPEAGTPAEFAFKDSSQQIFIYTAVVRRNGSYVLRVDIPGVPRIAKLFFVTTSFFGRLVESYGEEGSKKREIGAFLTNPSDCASGPLDSEVEYTTWANPEKVVRGTTASYPSVNGCDALTFNPTIAVGPESSTADEPSGYRVGVEVPQMSNFGPDAATPPIKNLTLSLPQGVSVSPGAANGLGVCQPTGTEGINLEGPESEETGPEGLTKMASGHCPSSSEVADVSATVPVLGEQLQGHIYIAAPKCGGAGQAACDAGDAENGDLFSGYLELDNPGLGIVVKLAGTLDVNASTGQIDARFENNPQFPVSQLVVHTTGGPRAPLANPQTCGQAITASAITAWSAAGTRPDGTFVSGTPEADPVSAFSTTGCSESFTPTVTAGATNTTAGAFTPFTFSLARPDRSQNIQRITTVLPPGLTAEIANVTRCTEPQASLGSCGEQSRIGNTTVSVGSGSAPYTVTGNVYLTEGYDGAPLGLSIVVPAVAGPFNLGLVVVRAAIKISPATAQVTVESDPLPQIRDGIPLRLKLVNITLNRPSFTLNPTSCGAQTITTTIASTNGLTNSQATKFAARGCNTLPFKPTFTTTTAGRASKAGGASLTVKITSKGGPGTTGQEANIRAVKVDLPIKLPSRLSTLQKACAEAQFNANPAGCPKESNVGAATAVTPILAIPLKGPAYLVSHGGEAFPDLEIVLQGEGITLILDGHTDIKKGVTSSTFRTVPDAPISSFELELPTGKFSILTTNLPQSAHYDLCGQALNMPTAITGQNGAEIHDTTKIAVSGCAKKKTSVKKKASVRKTGRLLGGGR